MTTASGTGLAVRSVAQASATGSRHARRGLGNEDAVRCSAIASGMVAAVADGHSDPRCVRARVGADFAVEAAVAVDATMAPADAAHAVVDGWRNRVDVDLLRNPLAGGGRLAYGTTLLACWVAASGLTLLRIGDGDLVLVDGTGAAWRPLPASAPADWPAGATNSLADPRAQHLAQVLFVPALRAPRLVLLASDGVDNAYPRSDDLLEAARDLADRRDLQEPARLQLEVAAWVAKAAETSGDDATAAVLLLEEEVR
jgi:serine/threonine protein phosphatase PrpC